MHEKTFHAFIPVVIILFFFSFPLVRAEETGQKLTARESLISATLAAQATHAAEVFEKKITAFNSLRDQPLKLIETHVLAPASREFLKSLLQENPAPGAWPVLQQGEGIAYFDVPGLRVGFSVLGSLKGELWLNGSRMTRQRDESLQQFIHRMAAQSDIQLKAKPNSVNLLLDWLFPSAHAKKNDPHMAVFLASAAVTGELEEVNGADRFNFLSGIVTAGSELPRNVLRIVTTLKSSADTCTRDFDTHVFQDTIRNPSRVFVSQLKARVIHFNFQDMQNEQKKFSQSLSKFGKYLSWGFDIQQVGNSTVDQYLAEVLQNEADKDPEFKASLAAKLGIHQSASGNSLYKECRDVVLGALSNMASCSNRMATDSSLSQLKRGNANSVDQEPLNAEGKELFGAAAK